MGFICYRVYWDQGKTVERMEELEWNGSPGKGQGIVSSLTRGFPYPLYTFTATHTHTLTERAREREIPTEGTRVKETQNLMDSKAQQPL